MKTLLALALLTQTADRPAWEIADRWTCTATQWRMCEGFAGECILHPGQAVFWIDFPAAKFGVSATVSRFDEAIVARHFQATSILPPRQQDLARHRRHADHRRPPPRRNQHGVPRRPGL
ncbi:hypothetical protein [Sphingomonas sp. G-3-2-10]|uniref:hypothetical protein n=1 Tax=Sphingomonas sp. G-3-2-10 TaxID=2728838 RepID=UPI00146B0BD8|nr:hypothetical protein [Sphingomonas sp. G-3-2-10]NML07915.1 hypothetical protein [Sphingomonas sp. G-3-2-10]